MGAITMTGWAALVLMLTVIYLVGPVLASATVARLRGDEWLEWLEEDGEAMAESALRRIFTLAMAALVLGLAYWGYVTFIAG
ncbi:hypothetical protein ACPVPU_07625 [Sphingomonas sp. CJ99]